MSNNELITAITSTIQRNNKIINYMTDKEHLIYMCPFFVLKDILNAQKIISKNYVSFSAGMPIHFSHGDIAIIFNKQKLLSRGYELHKINYTKKFLKENPDIEKHLLVNIESSKNKELVMKYLDEQIETLKKQSQISNVSTQIEALTSNRDFLKECDDPIEFGLNTISYENEVLLKQKEFEFSFNDIEAIIALSKSLIDYSSFNKSIRNKIIFVEDFFYIMYMPDNRITKYLNYIYSDYFSGQENVDFFHEVCKMYQYTYTMIALKFPKKRIFIKKIILSDEINSFLRVLDKKYHNENIKDDNFALQCLFYIWGTRIIKKLCINSFVENNIFEVSKIKIN